MTADDDDEDDREAPRWAADEPTAMWDESLMERAGYEELAQHRSEKPREETGPATGREVGGDESSAIHVSADLTGGHRAAAPAPKRGGVSWVLTCVLAVGLGVAVYVLVRLARGM